jgi:hypothetical protein
MVVPGGLYLPGGCSDHGQTPEKPATISWHGNLLLGFSFAEAFLQRSSASRRPVERLLDEKGTTKRRTHLITLPQRQRTGSVDQEAFRLHPRSSADSLWAARADGVRSLAHRARNPLPAWRFTGVRRPPDRIAFAGFHARRQNPAPLRVVPAAKVLLPVRVQRRVHRPLRHVGSRA